METTLALPAVLELSLGGDSYQVRILGAHDADREADVAVLLQAVDAVVLVGLAPGGGVRHEA